MYFYLEVILMVDMLNIWQSDRDRHSPLFDVAYVLKRNYKLVVSLERPSD